MNVGLLTVISEIIHIFMKPFYGIKCGQSYAKPYFKFELLTRTYVMMYKFAFTRLSEFKTRKHQIDGDTVPILFCRKQKNSKGDGITNMSIIFLGCPRQPAGVIPRATFGKNIVYRQK